jgi:hypothetical protein
VSEEGLTASDVEDDAACSAGFARRGIVATINRGLVPPDLNPLCQGVVILVAASTASLVSQCRAERLLRLND